MQFEPLNRLPAVCLAAVLSVASWPGVLAAAQTGGVTEDAETAAEDVDWPVVIARLRQEVQRRSGFKPLREQLAVALNNYGVELAEAGDLAQARVQLHEAMAMEPDNAQFSKNLASTYVSEAHNLVQGRRMREAKAAIEEAIRLDPGLPQAYALLGDIEYDQQQLKPARTAWERAIELDPGVDGVAERLERVTQELPVESKFERLSQAYFDIRYEGTALDRPVGFDVRNALLEARREVGRDFAYWPKYKIVVLVYAADSFRELRQETPEWVGGQYDGKIRVPLPGGEFDIGLVKQILFHEYTHALIHDQANGHCPVWLNEGIAEYEGRKHGPQRLEALRAAWLERRLYPLATLDDRFAMGLPVEQVTLGYQQSYSVARYLVERYGFWRLRRMLTAMAGGKTWLDLLREELHLKPERLEADWATWLPGLFAG